MIQDDYSYWSTSSIWYFQFPHDILHFLQLRFSHSRGNLVMSFLLLAHLFDTKNRYTLTIDISIKREILSEYMKASLRIKLAVHRSILSYHKETYTWLRCGDIPSDIALSTWKCVEDYRINKQPITFYEIQ